MSLVENLLLFRWYEFIKSPSFWRVFLTREFGAEAVRALTDEDLVKVRNEIEKGNVLRHMPYLSPCPDEIRIHLPPREGPPFTSLEEFGREMAKQLSIEQISQVYLVSAERRHSKYSLVNLKKLLPKVSSMPIDYELKLNLQRMIGS